MAEGTAQTRFGIHRASGSSSVGGLLTNAAGDYDFSTYSDINSEWTDVWSFDADGSFSASIDVNGSGSPANQVPGYDSLLPPQHDVGYGFVVTDLADPSCYGCVANIDYLQEVPSGDFHDDWPLSFDYQAGHAYEVLAFFILREENGWLLDFASTAVLANLELSAGSLSAESGTDYFDLPVPEPAAPVLVLVGVALMTGSLPASSSARTSSWSARGRAPTLGAACCCSRAARRRGSGRGSPARCRKSRVTEQ